MKKMKHIKLLKEFFDTEELKGENEIPVLTGELDFKELVKDAPNFFKRNRTAQGMHDLIAYKYPFFNFCVDGTKEGCGSDVIEVNGESAIRYTFFDDQMNVGISFAKEGSEYLISIFYKYADTEFRDDNFIVIEGPYNGEYITDKCICEVYYADTINEVMDIVGDLFIPLMDGFGFDNITHDVVAMSRKSMSEN